MLLGYVLTQGFPLLAMVLRAIAAVGLDGRFAEGQKAFRILAGNMLAAVAGHIFHGRLFALSRGPMLCQGRQVADKQGVIA